LTEGLRPWQAKKIYYFSDASHTEFLEGQGPEYPTTDVSASRHVPYYRIAAEEMSFHLTQGDSGQLAKQALASEAFRALNAEVTKAIRRQLKAGRTRVRLSAAQLPAVAFESTSSDLYWGFRGTQGLSVTGSGRSTNGRYAGTLTYVMLDSYGFPARDTLRVGRKHR